MAMDGQSVVFQLMTQKQAIEGCTVISRLSRTSVISNICIFRTQKTRLSRTSNSNLVRGAAGRIFYAWYGRTSDSNARNRKHDMNYQIYSDIDLQNNVVSLSVHQIHL